MGGDGGVGVGNTGTGSRSGVVGGGGGTGASRARTGRGGGSVGGGVGSLRREGESQSTAPSIYTNGSLSELHTYPYPSLESVR